MAQQVDVSKAVGFKYPVAKVEYNTRDLLIYAVGIGREENKFTYELDPQFSPFPTYPLVLPLRGGGFDVNSYAERSNLSGGSAIPGLPKIDLRRLVHGEQYLEIFAPIPKEGQFTLEGKLAGVWDTGKGMILDNESTLKDKEGKTICKMISSAFIIGGGGFNGPKKPAPSNVVPTPKREPDAIQVDKLLEIQAKIYRISGDYNPLHADPSIAKKLGMEREILHGLCFYGFSAAAVLKHFGGNNPATFKSIYGRFASPVYPGETLETHMWKVGEKDGNTAIAFVTKVKERNIIVIANGTVILTGVTSKL